MGTESDVIAVLGGPEILRGGAKSMRELDAMIVSNRLPRRSFERVMARLGIARSEWHGFIPRATYQRHKRALPRAYGEATERLARVYTLVRSLWRNDDDARLFMSTPHLELGGETPLSRARTELGAREVEQIIYRGIHGFPV
jgi:putative toxin-antitoxin system antitoxin component (TIGR02293 family)